MKHHLFLHFIVCVKLRTQKKCSAIDSQNLFFESDSRPKKKVSTIIEFFFSQNQTKQHTQRGKKKWKSN